MTLTVLGVLIKYFWRLNWDLFDDFLLVRVELSVSGEKTVEVKRRVKSICYQHDLWPLMLPSGAWLRFARFLHWKILSFPSTLCSGLPRWLSGKEPTCQHRRHKRRRFHPWVGKIFWKRKWQPTPVFLPGKLHGQKSLVSYSPWGHSVSDMTQPACLALWKEVRGAHA